MSESKIEERHPAEFAKDSRSRMDRLTTMRQDYAEVSGRWIFGILSLTMCWRKFEAQMIRDSFDSCANADNERWDPELHYHDVEECDFLIKVRDLLRQRRKQGSGGKT